MLRNKKLLILGGSKISCEIVKEAKKRGVYTIVTDWYPIEDSPAKQIADKSFEISTTDEVALEKLIIDEGVDGILTGFTDSTLIPYAKICKKMNLPCYGSEELFELFTDKKNYKKKFKEYGIPLIEEIQVRNEDEKISDNKFPVLIKPVDGSGSKGISICKTPKDFSELYKKAKVSSQKKQVIVERYMEGKELTVFFLFNDGDIILSATGDRHMSEPQEEGILPLPVGYTFPSIQEKNFKQNIFNKLKKLFEDEKVDNGMMFMQCKVENDIIYIYDVGYRLTGSLEYKIQEEIQGFNSLEMLINYALTGKMTNLDSTQLSTETFKKIGLNVSILTKVDYKLENIVGIDKVLKHKNIIDIIPAKTENQNINPEIKGTLAQIAIRILAYADNVKEIEEIINMINKEIKLLSNDNNNMVLTKINIENWHEELSYLESIYG